MPYKNVIVQPAQFSEQHRLQTSQFYKGFSTVDESNKSNQVYDFDIVKQDLLNHFNTRLGERVMNPRRPKNSKPYHTNSRSRIRPIARSHT
jgi:hypothetical protein